MLTISSNKGNANHLPLNWPHLGTRDEEELRGWGESCQLVKPCGRKVYVDIEYT
jgi:hypothetical protein